MKLTLQIKLLPSKEQTDSLLKTLKQCNKACNEISKTAWKQKAFNQFKLHHFVYHKIKNSFNLSAQILVRCISKVADAYKSGKRKKRIFKLLGAITYDSRILSYRKENIISIWSVDGRLKIPFICHNPKYFPFIKGEADLVYKNNKFFLFQTVEVPEEKIKDVEKFIGVDFGVIEIATLSDGTKFSSDELNKVRDKYFRVRKSLQSKGTRGSRKCLKRLKGRERRHATIINHTISKRIVRKAKTEEAGIAIEDLTNIRKKTRVRKAQRRKHSNWAFSQLRAFLDYKSRLARIPLAIVKPEYTSQTCNVCKHLGNRNGKHFNCTNCGNIADADINAAKNISQLGLLVNQPEKSYMFSSAIHVTS